MTDLVGQTPLAGRDRRTVIRAGNNIAADALVAQLKVEGVAHVAARTAERLVDLDNRRELLATNDILNQLLVRVEMGFIAKALEVQGKLFNGLGGL